jgi:type II secretory pathway pseudopilin PulG
MRKITAQSGFSLVELILVIAVAIMILAILANITPAMNLINTSNHETTAQQIAAKRLEQIRAQGFDSLANGTSNISDPRLTSLTQGDAITIISDCPSAICTNNEPIKSVEIEVSWVENNKPVKYSLNTLISDGGLK